MRVIGTCVVLGTILLGTVVGKAKSAGSGRPNAAPDLDYFFTPNIPVDGWDAPAISNHWLWAQAAFRNGRGILNMEDVRCGGQPTFNGTAIVVANGREVRPGKTVAYFAGVPRRVHVLP